MEVAFICLQETNLEVLGIIDDSKDKHGKKIFGFSIQKPGVVNELKSDAVLVTSIRYKDEILQKLKKNKVLKGISFYSL